MFKRRDIRVKALQVAYSVEIGHQADINLELPKALKLYDTMNKESELLVYFFINIILQIVNFSSQVSDAEKHKLVIQDINKTKTSTKLAKNIVAQHLQVLVDNYNKKNRSIKIDDIDLIRQLFFKLSATEEYVEYCSQHIGELNSEMDIIIFILKKIVQYNEVVEGIIEDKFLNAIEDTQTVLYYVIDKIQQFPNIEFEHISTVQENILFGKELIKSSIQKSNFIEEIILKNTDNWAKERMVVIDKVILKLAICEFLYFDNIPIKVSINEYIEISKEFSTFESKSFVNGILDALQKKLTNEGKISVNKKT